MGLGSVRSNVVLLMGNCCGLGHMEVRMAMNENGPKRGKDGGLGWDGTHLHPLSVLPSREGEVRRCLETATMLLRLDRKTLVLSRAKLRAFGCNAEEINSLAYDWEIQE